jgi:hypothetical protein
VWQTDGHEFVNKRIRQHFTGHGFTLGTITKWVPQDVDDPAMFHVIHDDGDEEDLDEMSVVVGIRAFDLMVATKKRIKGARRAHRDSYLSDRTSEEDASDSDSEFSSVGAADDDDEEDEEDEDEETSDNGNSGSAKKKKRRRTKQSHATGGERANNQVAKRRKRTSEKKTTRPKKLTKNATKKVGINRRGRAKRMSVHEIHVFLRRLVYCLEKGRVNTDEHPHHDVMVRKCAESQRDEFAIAPATKCVVLGLSSDKGKLLNGKDGVVVYLETTTTPHRYVVRLTKTGTWHRLRPGNVKQIPNRGVAICNVTSKPEMNGCTGDVVSLRKDGKFVVNMPSGAECDCGGTFVALKPEKLILPPGTAVVLHSLKAKEALNGVRGCLVTYQNETGRYVVRIPDATSGGSKSAEDEMKTVAVKPANIWS